MRKTILGFCFFFSAAVQAAPELIPTAFDYRLLNWQSRDGSTIVDSGTVSSNTTGNNEVFDQSVSNATGTASQNSFMHKDGANSGPVFLYGTGSANATLTEELLNTTRSAYTGSFTSTESFTATVSGILEAHYNTVGIFEAAAWVKLWDGNPLGGTLIWSQEAVSGFANEVLEFSYTHTFEANKMYVLEVNAYSSKSMDPPSEPNPLTFTQSGSWEFTFELEVPAVDIDVLPGDEANQVYPNQTGKLPVAVLSSAEFDATQVNPATLKFGAAEAGVADQITIGDVDGQNGADTTARFWVQDSGIFCNDTEVTLTGTTYAGDHFEGVDTIDATECETGGCHNY